jgi:hypothetical protein
MTEVKNLPASVAARLLNLAKQSGDDYQTVLVAYCFERFLHRLGASDVKDRFVLKGAMLLRLWSDRPYRTTRDLDLLRRGDGSFNAIRADIDRICNWVVEPDGVVFDADEASIQAIRAEDEYAGTRAILPARCNTARLALQIDMGVGDAVWPAPQALTYPAMLAFRPAEVLAYPREAVVAEKLEALVVLGDRNSRIKDFFDLHYLASRFEFDRATLAQAVRRTFARRHTSVSSEEPIGLTPAYWENPSRPAQVKAFVRRARLEAPVGIADELARVLGAFLSPIVDDLRTGATRKGAWPPGGPWQ